VSRPSPSNGLAECTADHAVDPRKRYTVEQCLAHPYLDAYHDPDDEPSAKPLPSDFFDFDLQKDAISRSELKELLYEEIMAFNPV
jgi:mitogen-activated protein kinase 1/3